MTSGIPMFTLGRQSYAESDSVEVAVNKHEKKEPKPNPKDDGQAPGIPKESDPGKHGKKK